jgi:putative membrane protein
LAVAAIAWNRWSFEPAVIIPIVLVCLAYGLGALRRRAPLSTAQLWRHLSFVAGMAILWLTLATPLNGMAVHLYLMQQMQDALLVILVPILLVAAAPGAILIAALPAGLRPAAMPSVARGIFTVFGSATVATALFIAAVFVWQYPPYHDAAILSAPLRAAMHLSLLAAGLLFWARIFDAAPAPIGLGYGRRLMMLWIVALSHIGLGAYLTLKSEILYPAYDVMGRLFGIAPLTDEATGGFIIWVPSALLCLAAAIMVIHLWGVHEDRVWNARPAWSSSNSDALLYPTTGAALIEIARPKNRKLALGVIGFVFAVFAMTIFTGVLNHLKTVEHHGRLAAHAQRVSAVR